MGELEILSLFVASYQEAVCPAYTTGRQASGRLYTLLHFNSARRIFSQKTGDCTEYDLG
jgi:hypothetical protein